MNSSETQALEKIWRMGGKASINAVARAMRINSDYARVILFGIGEKDYIDINRAGICKITETGKESLKSRGILAKIAKEEKERKKQTKIQIGQGKSKIITINY